MKVILLTLLVIGGWYGLKAGVNLLMVKFAVFSKLGALRAVINPWGFMRKSTRLIWKVIKNGAIVIAIMTVISLCLR